MGKYAYLIKVDAGENNNKFYEMIEKDDGTIALFNGRVESSRVAQKPKPMSSWNKIFNSKIKKGYKDVTEFRSVVVDDNQVDTQYVDIKDKDVVDIINKLQTFAGQSVSSNYSVKSAQVTQKMVDEAQYVIDEISSSLKLKADIIHLNDRLQYLYTVIPRKMTKVSNHLFEKISDKDALTAANVLMANEQDILDSMAGQVIQNTAVTVNKNKDVQQKSILTDLGITMEVATDKEFEMIKRRMFDHSGASRSKELIRAFRVNNIATAASFDNHLANAKNKNTMFMFHGSRNQNWMFILPQGLKIRPSNAVHTGSMWGDGIYGADANDAKTPLGNPNPGYAKAYGYTSSSRAYWTSGGAKEHVYMAIMEFHVGKQKHYYTHSSDAYSIDYQKIQKGGFDSVYAHGRNDGGKASSLMNSEFIIYNSNQATIRYILELEN